MDQYVTGAAIRELRTKKNMTQAELAQKLLISDKTVSKWETGKGYPDITLLQPLAEAFDVSVTELLSGNTVSNSNRSANILRSLFYVCPVCGNVIHAMGEAVISCHGVSLIPQQAEPADEDHDVTIEDIEDELYVSSSHDMTKEHYISFIAGMSYDGVQTVKLYPEGPAECRLMRRGVQRVYFYCNRDGLYYKDIKRARPKKT